MSKIKIDLRTDIKKVRGNTADVGSCSYTAPCAVGAMLDPKDRQRLRRSGFNSVGISPLMTSGEIECPEDQRFDVAELQRAFDSGSPFRFEEQLELLEKKYV